MVSNSNIAGLLWQHAAHTPGALAIVGGDEVVRYDELVARASGIARSLLAAGVRPGEPVGMLLGRGADAAAAFFGTAAIGAIAVMIDDGQRPPQIEHMLAHSGARRLVTIGSILEAQPRPIQGDANIIDLARIEPVASDGFTPAPRHANDIVQIVYTSGSTGMPKGVAVTHGNLGASTRAVVEYLQISPDDRIASLLPFSFVYGLSQLLCAAHRGATLVVENSPLPQEIAISLRAGSVTVLAAVPSLWLRLLRAPAFRDRVLPALRVMTNAGGHLPVDAVRLLRRVQPEARLYLMYGLTEALRCTYLPPEEVDQRPDSIGRPLPGADVYVIRDDGTPAAPHEVGELVYRGLTVALGYWRDPENTARVFRPNPVRPMGAPDSERVVFSGDLVRRDADGFLYFVGRKDRIIKTMGFRVGPDEVAEVLYASGEVLDAEVLGEPDELWGARIVAHVTLVAGGSLERLKAHCDRDLPRHMRPSRIEVRDALPLLSSGKRDLGALDAAASNTA